MKTAYCECCGSAAAEAEFHLSQMDGYHALFARRYKFAVQEYERLQELLQNAIWFNFETVARDWVHPWPLSMQETTLSMRGMRFELISGRGGHKHEVGTFPVYYQGTVRDAPPLPPEIVLEELNLAHAHMLEMEAACTAPYDWAPGGRLYERMLRESPGVAAFSSNPSVRDRI